MKEIQFTDKLTPVNVIHGLIKDRYFKDNTYDITLV